MVKDKGCCNYCLNYQPIKKNGKKTSKGKCKATGSIKSRIDTCKKSFRDKRMMSFLTD
ncbi:hypothetical protein [Clostridium neonatale]|uniref:hypothetical protein n=1 Tax=Clostridium neonatale TaxID=137838 RepID=UPI00397DAC5D